jgi:hypothetical protein
MLLLLSALTSCEQENVEPELGAADGGGTLTTYKAYALESQGGSLVYGRIVFWKGNAKNTLVQISLYNTAGAETYPSGIYEGASEDASPIQLVPLYTINGSTGEFSTHKFFVIDDEEFYGNLGTYNAHVSIFLGTDLVAAGDVGTNAEPVAEED